jgi:uncharacterized membrane protein
MRSSPSAALGAALAVVAGVSVLGPACGADTDRTCGQSFLRYDNFGAPFIVDWCRACHSADAPADMRQQAPADMNFDTLSEIRHWSLQIRLTAGDGSSMPPAGGPSSAERQMLVEWLGCGAP